MHVDHVLHHAVHVIQRSCREAKAFKHADETATFTTDIIKPLKPVDLLTEQNRCNSQNQLYHHDREQDQDQSPVAAGPTGCRVHALNI